MIAYGRGLSIINIVKGELINMTRARNKEKIRVTDRNRTRDLPNTRREPYPLNYEKLC